MFLPGPARFAFAALAFLPALARADEPKKEEPKKPALTGALEGGATATSGNTNVETYTGAAKADANWLGWGIALRANGVYARSAGVQTAGAYEASLRGDRKLVGPLAAYVRLSIDGDTFKGIDNRKGAGAGLTAVVWKRTGEGFDRDLLRTELGYQFIREDLALTDDTHDINAARGFVGYAHAFTKETVFSEEVEALSDLQDEKRLLVNSVTALTVKLHANLAFKASETIKADTEPKLVDPAVPTGPHFQPVDSITALSMILTF